MSVSALLADIEAAGVRLTATPEGKLTASPAGLLSDAQKNALKDNREEVLRLLACPGDAEVDAIAHCIADYPDSRSPIVLLRWPSDPSTVLAVPQDVLDEWDRQTAEARRVAVRPKAARKKHGGDLFVEEMS